MPNLPAVMPVAANDFINLFMKPFFTYFRQLMIEAERQATRFRVGKIVTTYAGVQTFHPVEDQAVDGVT